MIKPVYLIIDADKFGLPCAVLYSIAECSEWLGCSSKKVSGLIKSQKSYKGFRVELI